MASIELSVKTATRPAIKTFSALSYIPPVLNSTPVGLDARSRCNEKSHFFVSQFYTSPHYLRGAPCIYYPKISNWHSLYDQV